MRELTEHTAFDVTAGVPDSLTVFMNQLGRYPLLSTAQEVELAKRVERGDRAAKERMINSNLRLVVHHARRYQGHDVPLADLVQEGTIGLNRAVEKFDHRKGFKFSTYASGWIRQSCQRAVGNQSKTIRIPLHVDERRRKLARARQQFEARHGREPTIEELAEAAQIEPRHAEEALEAVEASVSLNQPVGDGDAQLGDLFPDPDSPDALELAADALRKDAVQQALTCLPEQERQIIEWRFGFNGKPWTLKAIENELGLTREHLHELEGQALTKLEARLAGVDAESEELADAA